MSERTNVKMKLNVLVAGMFLMATSSGLATVRYVNINNANSTPPYTSWATAATNIQDAVDAAGAGDEILVTNGTYAGGSRVDTNGQPNCVLVDKPLVLSSVNGPDVTIIDGGGGVRCVYLTNNAVMVGFTLANGLTGGNGGGVYCEFSAVLTNCVLTGSLAYNDVCMFCHPSGGGAYGGTLNNCTLAGNSADAGGGASGSTLNNCKLIGNSAHTGGGASDCTLNNCTLTGNSAGFFGGGGGAADSTLNNCTLTGNYSASGGGGAWLCTLNNCIIYFNSDPVDGGNYDSSNILNYCCTTPLPTNGLGNISTDPQLASASHLSALSPCIGAGSAIYVSGTDIDGEAWANPPSIGCDEYHAGAVTGPLTVSLTATYTNVAIGFPVGLTAFIAGRTDLSVWDFGDGYVAVNEPYTSHTWTAPGDYLVALWAFNDSYPEGVSAMVTVRVLDNPVQYVALGSTNPVAPYLSWATAATNIQDAVNALPSGRSLVLVSNGTYASVEVYRPLTVQSVNGPDVTVIDGGGAMRCLYLTNNAVMVGFTLTNGVGFGGGGAYCESTNAVLTNCALTGNSTSGFGSSGGGACGGTLNNCTLTGNSAPYGGYGGGAADSTLNKCTLTGNVASGSGSPGGYYPGAGGGAFGCTLNNCTLTGNSTEGFGMALGGSCFGGGAEECMLNNCTLTDNSATTFGGGADSSTLNNCTLTGNSASDGGGAFDCTLNNCIVYFNTATNGANYYQDQYGGVLNYCCTMPMPTNGVGNITNAPLFVDYVSGNLRLQSNSPCINSGNNASVVGSTDLDGNPRIVFGTVDIGAYEYQTPASIISYAWLQQYGLPADGSADHADLDGTGMNVYQDWIAGLNPTNALSVLKMLLPAATNNPLGLVVSWQSVSNITYFLQRTTNLAAQPAFFTIQSNIVGLAGTTSYTDTTATNAGPYFYRVGVGNSAFNWVDVTTTSVQAVPNTGYLADSASQVTITLPGSPALDDIVWVSGVGAGGWQIAQNAGQSIVTEGIETIGAVWTERYSPGEGPGLGGGGFGGGGLYYSVASSADGTRLMAAAVSGNGTCYTSSDSGVTWTAQAAMADAYAVASSADGTKLVVATDSGIYTSSDSGVTWIPASLPVQAGWTSVASSADGAKLVAGVSWGGIYTSSDFGATWTAQNPVPTVLLLVASSADGTKLVAAGTGIYTSSDSGVTWTLTSAPSDSFWQSIASSADGTKLVAVGGDGMYASSDSGVTWTLMLASPTRPLGHQLWRSIACSADGTKLVAVSGNCLDTLSGQCFGSIYTSLNSGVTWNLTSAPYGFWGAVASSSDGTKLIAGGGGAIFTSQPSAVGSTTVGTAGSMSGGQYDAVELQYIGNNTFMVLSHEGYLEVQ